MNTTILNQRISKISYFDKLDAKELTELIRLCAHSNKMRVIPDGKITPKRPKFPLEERISNQIHILFGQQLKDLADLNAMRRISDKKITLNTR